jgi:hypothetical protein
MMQQPAPPSYWSEFHGWRPYPSFGQSIFNFPRIGGGFSNPMRSFDQSNPMMANPLLMASLAQAQNAPTGYDQGGAITPFDKPLPAPPKKPTKIHLTAEEAAFCRHMGIPYAKFAHHKIERGLS